MIVKVKITNNKVTKKNCSYKNMPKEINNNTMSPQFDKLNNKNNTNNAVSRLIINNLIIYLTIFIFHHHTISFHNVYEKKNCREKKTLFIFSRHRNV